MAVNKRPLLGVLFKGVYLPQKLDLAPPLETRRNSFPKHVSSYQVEMTESCFVWAAPPLLIGPSLCKNEKNSLKIRERCKITLSIANNVWRADGDYFRYLKYGSTCKKYCNSICSGLVAVTLIVCGRRWFESSEVRSMCYFGLI